MIPRFNFFFLGGGGGMQFYRTGIFDALHFCLGG